MELNVKVTAFWLVAKEALKFLKILILYEEVMIR